MSKDKWYIRQVMSGQRKRAAAAVLLASDIVVTEIKKETPVDTGNLKGNNQKRKINDLHWQVFNNTSYAPPVEFGTVKMKAQPFMRPGYRVAKKKVKRVLAKI